MTAFDDAIKKLDRAIELSSEIHVEAERIMLHQRIVGILIGIAIIALPLLIVWRLS